MARKLSQNPRAIKRRQIRRYLREVVGLTPKQADNKSSRFSLLKVARSKGSSNKVLNRSVKNYYTSIGLSNKEAWKRSGRRGKLIQDHINYIRKNNAAIWNKELPTPKIPPALFKHHVKALITIQKKLNKTPTRKLEQEFLSTNPTTISRHIMRLERFIAKLPRGAIEGYTKTMLEQTEIDDYYKQMAIESSNVIRLNEYNTKDLHTIRNGKIKSIKDFNIRRE